jgi:hypothetical protein
VAADHKTPLILEAVTRCGSVKRAKILILRGDSAYEKVPEALTQLGAVVDVVPCYDVVPETEDPAGGAAAMLEAGADWITFASGLAIEHIHARFDLSALMARFPTMRVALSRPDDAEDLVNAIVCAEAASQETDRRHPRLRPLPNASSLAAAPG